MTKIERTPLFFIDCQTTGSSHLDSKVIEVAWSLVNPSHPDKFTLDSFLVRLRKENDFPNITKKLTGLVFDDLKESGFSKKFVKTSFIKTLDNLPPQAIIVAHFASFESRFLLQFINRKKFNFEVLCTQRLARIFFPEIPSSSLRALAGRFGYEGLELKRSADHIMATKLIWSELGREAQKRGLKDIDSLLEISRQKIIQKDRKKKFLIDRRERLDLPEAPGIYKFLRKDGKILYIGKSKNIRRRVNSYFQKKIRGHHNELFSQVYSIQYHKTNSELDALLTEFSEISLHSPPYNISLKSSRFGDAFDSQFHKVVHGIGRPYGVGNLKSLDKILADARSLPIVDSPFPLKTFDTRRLFAAAIKFYRFSQRLKNSAAEDQEEQEETIEDTREETKIKVLSWPIVLSQLASIYRASLRLRKFSDACIAVRVDENEAEWTVYRFFEFSLKAIEYKQNDQNLEKLTLNSKEDQPWEVDKLNMTELGVFIAALRTCKRVLILTKKGWVSYKPQNSYFL